MFAVIFTGGKQYKVEKGKTFEFEKLEGKEGDAITFDKVLLIHDKDTKVGTPLIDGAQVKGKITAHKRGDKIIVFKMKPKKRYQKTQGHRQDLTVVEITDIKATGGKKVAKKEEKAETKKAPVKKTTAKKEE